LISIIDGDVIEAFLELSGGGKPENAKNLTNEQEILNALEESFEVSDDLNSDSDSEQPRKDSILTEQKEEDSAKNNNENMEFYNHNFVKHFENEQDNDKDTEDIFSQNKMDGKHHQNVSEGSSTEPLNFSNEINCSELTSEQYLEDLRKNRTFSKKKP
jgi:hypothetical protein